MFAQPAGSPGEARATGRPQPGLAQIRVLGVPARPKAAAAACAPVETGAAATGPPGRRAGRLPFRGRRPGTAAGRPVGRFAAPPAVLRGRAPICPPRCAAGWKAVPGYSGKVRPFLHSSCSFLLKDMIKYLWLEDGESGQDAALPIYMQQE